MNTKTDFLRFLAITILMAFIAMPASAEDKKDETEDGEFIVGPSYQPEVVGYEGSNSNKDYKAKTDSEGAEWFYNVDEIDVTEGTSATGTNFQGARILEGGVDVVIGGTAVQGSFGQEDESSFYANWQGSTYYFGVQSTESDNSVDGIVEFYWFESSIPRGSDFYVMQIKVKSSPDVWHNWRVATEPNFVDEHVFFWNDIQPAQVLDVYMEEGGDHGSLRWDFSVPFDTYEWQPEKTMQIREKYGAGYELKGNLGADGNAGVQFKEGGQVADASADADIQSKGYINESFSVQSQYTVTLYHWQMLVQSGGQEIHYKTVILPNSVDYEADKDSAYHEYFVVLQATRGTPVHIDDIHIGASFRKSVWYWLDPYEHLSVSIGDIWITPPTGICIPGDIAPEGTCNQLGVCGLAPPRCVSNQWECAIVDAFQEEEFACDGLDNDCDGVTDEDLDRVCETACGTGVEKCQFGAYQSCSAPQPEPEICGDGIDNDCNGWVDDGEACAPEPVEEPEEEIIEEEVTEEEETTEEEVTEEPEVEQPGSGDPTGGPVNSDAPTDSPDPDNVGGYYNGNGEVNVAQGTNDGSAGCQGSQDASLPLMAGLLMLAAVLRRRLTSAG